MSLLPIFCPFSGSLGTHWRLYHRSGECKSVLDYESMPWKSHNATPLLQNVRTVKCKVTFMCHKGIMEQAVGYDAVIVHYQHSAVITTHLLQSKTVHLICPWTFNLHFLVLFIPNWETQILRAVKRAGGVNYLQKWRKKNPKGIKRTTTHPYSDTQHHHKVHHDDGDVCCVVDDHISGV